MGTTNSNDRSMTSTNILPSALKLPIFEKLSGKRIILASSSPRRLQILQSIGINPEVIPSQFKEDLDQNSFEDLDDVRLKGIRYAAATATEKAIEVYRRLVVEQPENAPDLVIGADTIVQTYSNKLGLPSKILEKPENKSNHLSMLEDLVSFNDDNDHKIEVITGIVLIYPCLESPGYRIKEFAEVTRIWFGDLEMEDLIAYVENGEGFDRAGGFAAQGIGCQFIRRIDGDWNNVVGFPAYAFLKFSKNLLKDDSDFLAD
ncbi:hypothetical protein CROQUDRAFT_80670 [Cronartium quercuum f. sp. fusiforme G11]|uniref:Maf-like protein n=1 Tax=Cronartium quercuum f. sp. fusiforme G11 TaxID=708437 RepID=A0A9P6NHQ8_9BASI|nr:hypothetical protein CROQUDRAFT_80670 [Cronartium quercuum f. sp. fusiforme G11]